MTLYSIVLVAIFVGAGAVFVALLFLDAPYGRFARGGWGLTLTARASWFLMEFPAAASILIMAVAGPRPDPVALVFLAAWEVHYVYRSLLYPFLLRENRARTMPVALVAMAIVYNVANGYVNGYWLFFVGRYTADWLADPRFILGGALFTVGMITHVWSDRILQRLRTPGEREYRIPRGGPFRFVSSPNYLGEIVQWCGFALATWSLAGLSFAVFTIANLLPRALATHRWYRETFEDYPEDRKAIIPFVV
ncbi:MAG: methyltransferase [Spirochaetota bacterium]